jgi:hypothetical protein
MNLHALTRRWRRGWAALLAVALLAPAIVLAAAGPANAAFVTPQYVRSIGGSGRPGVFSWGVQHNPVTNEILVSDYLHFKIRRYDLNGNHLGDFWRDNACGQPYSIGVDPRDGAIYVAELKDNPFQRCIAKYNSEGTFMYRIAVGGGTGADTNRIGEAGRSSFNAFYPVWMTIEEDTGDMFVLDSHYSHTDETNPPEMLQLRWDDLAQRITIVAEWPVMPPEIPVPCNNPIGCAPRIYGVDIATTTEGDPNNDVIYMTDAWNRRAYRYSKTGQYLSTFAQTQTGGDNRGLVVNEALDRVYIVDAEHSDVDVFRMNGSYVNSFGSEGTGPGQFSGGGRQVDIDGAGNVWVGDFGGFETEKFSPTGAPLDTAPAPARKPPVGLMGQPRDVAVDDATGEVWVADSWNQRFSRYSSTGAHMGTWGQRGPGGPFDMNYPRSIAIQPPANGRPKRIWISNERGHHIQVYNYPTTAGGSPTYVTQIGAIGQDNTDPGNFRWPVDIEFYTRPDGTQVAVMGDRMAPSVKIFDAGTFEELLMIPGGGLATAVDPANGNIYALQGTRVTIYDQAGTQLGRFGSSGTAEGQFRDTTDAVFANGLLYVTDEVASKVSVFQPGPNPAENPAVVGDELTATFVGRWGSTFGANVYDFKGAIGIDADAAGRIYVVDVGNDRIQVFNPAAGRQFESTAPAIPVVSVPAQAQANLTTLGPVTLSGTATDNVAVGNVEVSIQDYTTGLWWNAFNQSWEATQPAPAIAAYSGTNASSVSWRWVFLGVSVQGRYVAQFKTRDHNGNLSQVRVRTFAMPGATAPPLPTAPVLDTVRPDGLQAAPTANQVFPRAPVAFSGTASDNIGVTSVRIAVKRLSDGRWLSSPTSSSFGTAFTWHETVLDVPGGAAVNWNWTWSNPPSAGGSFQTLVEARDAAGNVDSSKPQIPFSTTNLTPDTVAPETVLAAPALDSSFESGPVDINGSATDNQAVAAVRLTIQNTGTGLYWTGSAWSAAPATVNAGLATPNATASTWSYSFSPGVAGSFTVAAAAADATGNADATPDGATTGFSLTSAPPDTVNPDATVAVPTAGGFLAGPAVVLSGNANDNVGVGAVDVAVRNRTAGADFNKWWNGTGWQTVFVWFAQATLDSPGSASTGWSYTWNSPAPGPYTLQVRARDTATSPAGGNADASRPSVQFTVT